MSFTITISDELEAQLRDAAATRGQDVNSYAVGVLQEASRRRGAGGAKVSPASPAELIAKLEAEGVLAGYGDPAVDSPELARALRGQFSRRGTAT